MKLSEYFEHANGLGILATADADGKVDAAVFTKPHFPDPDDDTVVAFFMADGKSHSGVQDNPNAAYIFIEQSDLYVGKRLSLVKVKEKNDAKEIDRLRLKWRWTASSALKYTHLVYFRVEQVRPL